MEEEGSKDSLNSQVNPSWILLIYILPFLQNARGSPRRRWSSVERRRYHCFAIVLTTLSRVLGRCHVDSCAVDTGGVEAVTSKGPNTCFSLQLRLDASLLLMESAAAASLIWWMKTKTPVAHCRDNKKSEICTADAFSPLWVAPLWSLRRDNFFFFFFWKGRVQRTSRSNWLEHYEGSSLEFDENTMILSLCLVNLSIPKVFFLFDHRTMFCDLFLCYEMEFLKMTVYGFYCK